MRWSRTLSFAIGLALVAGTLVVGSPPAAAAPNGYVRMSDGVLIAVNVRMPQGFEKGKRYPAILEMSGYDGGSAQGRTLLGEWADMGGYEGEVPLGDDSRYLTEMFTRDYVTVHASVRGTGCSGGEFDLFSWRSALDGREVVEWMARQPWSDGKVGIMGHSYGGITGFMIGATRPPHLTAMTVSGLIDDLYRGITYPGGVSNLGFPLLWTLGIRTLYDVGGGTMPGIVRTQDPVCAQNLATHRRTVVNDPVVQGAAGDTDNDWWRARSLVTYAERIDVPIHITGAWQDEQTGPRFPHLFELVGGVPKRMVTTNGVHSTDTDPREIWRDRLAWMDHWMRGKDGGFGTGAADRSSVVTLLEMHRAKQGLRSTGRIESRTFPLEQTRWTDLFLRRGGRLGRSAPKGDEPSDTYFSGSGRQSWSYQAGPTEGSQLSTPDGPDELTYRSGKVKRDTAVVGPITATLHVSSSAPETELFVQLVDEAPDGTRTYLQRGMLRASHRAVDPGLSDWARSGGERILYRPFHPHVNPTEIVPGQTYEYLVEVFPVGHVFRKGHRIVVKVHAPPHVDSYYAYPRRTPPAANTVLHDPEHPSRITLPIVPLDGVDLAREPACGEQAGVRCIPA